MTNAPQPAKETTVICPVCGLELPASLKKCPQDGVALKAFGAGDPLVGTVVAGRYEILSLVGRGGMSVVYKARNRAVGSIVAVKTLKSDLVHDEELFARFCQEAKAVQLLIHPNIITVHEFGVTLDGQPFIVMDFLNGETLADAIEKTGRIPVKRTLRIFSQVCDALANAHSNKMIHRDIKPGNIMLIQTANESDVVKLFDFGFCKLLPNANMTIQALTQTGDVLGTPLYMSPEQSRGKTLDSRSDIYAVGCVMYEALTGKAPLIGENVLDTMQKQINERPEALDLVRPDLYIPHQLTTVLFKCLEKNPDKRYQSAIDLKRDLEVIANGMTGKAMVSHGVLPGLSKLKELPEDRPGPLEPAVAALLVAALVVGGGIWIYQQTTVKPDGPIVRATIEERAPTFTGDPAMVWAKYRQAGMLALEHQRYNEAADCFNLAMDQASKTNDSANRTATSLIDLAHVQLKMGKFSDAQKCAMRAESVRRELGQSNERPMADVFVCLGEIALAKNAYKEADSYLQQALAIQQRELGPTHQDVATTLDMLGQATEGENNLRRADSYYKQAIAVFESAVGPDKPAVADALTNYARLLRKMSKHDEAARAETRAASIGK